MKISPSEEEIIAVVEAARREVKYLVTDFSAELIATKFKEKAETEGDIFIPDYQRNLAWNREKMSYFIESLILRVPIPPIFFNDVGGKLEIVDGSQRVRTLVKFRKNEFRLFNLEKLEIINGAKYSDLPPVVRNRLDNTPIRSFVLDDSTDESTRIDVFRRLNTSGKRLEDAQIRKGAYRGAFLDLVLDSTDSEAFRRVLPELAGGADAESERQELVTRFYVYSQFYGDFRHDVRRFLDERMIELNRDGTPEQFKAMRAEFEKTMQFIFASEPRAFYRDATRRAPRVRFEAIAVGVALALRAQPNLGPGPFLWLASTEFEQLIRTDASNSGPRLRGRIEYVRDRLIGA